MAFKLHDQRSEGGLASFHIHESSGAMNKAVYVIVPVMRTRAGRLQVNKAARQAAKQALLDAAAAL